MFFVQTSWASEFTVNCFLSELKKGDFLKASRYISKNYLDKINLSLFSNIKNYKKIVCMEFGEVPKNCKKDTFLIEGRLVHFYSFKEKDVYAIWKIYNVEF